MAASWSLSYAHHSADDSSPSSLCGCFCMGRGAKGQANSILFGRDGVVIKPPLFHA